MERAAIFGAGQAGRMISRWMPTSTVLECYIDNNSNKHGTQLGNILVVSLADALTRNLDVIWIATLNIQAAASIEKQIREAGFEGSLRYAHEFRSVQDLRLAGLRLIADEINAREINGAVAELGVFKGEFAAELNRLFPNKEIYLFDTFEGFAESDLRVEKKIIGENNVWHPDFADTCIESVMARLPYPEKAHFVKGYFPNSTEQLRGDEKYIFVNIDPDLYEPTRQGLAYFWPRMEKGGVIMIHDYNSVQFPGVGKAVREFVVEKGIMPVPLADLHGSVLLTKI